MSNLPENQPTILLREEFLRRVTARLRFEMSPFELDDTIRELRTHLIASAAAFEEVGLSPDEAMKAAILKFGQPEVIDDKLVRETRKAKCNPRVLISIAWTALVCGPLMVGADYTMVLTKMVSSPSEGMVLVGLVAGAIIGISLERHPRKPLVAAVRASILLPAILELLCFGLNRGLPGTGLILAGTIAFGTAGFFTGLISSWGQGVLKRHYARPGDPPAALG